MISIHPRWGAGVFSAARGGKPRTPRAHQPRQGRQTLALGASRRKPRGGRARRARPEVDIDAISRYFQDEDVLWGPVGPPSRNPYETEGADRRDLSHTESD